MANQAELPHLSICYCESKMTDDADSKVLTRLLLTLLELAGSDDRWMTAQEAAQLVNVDPETIKNWAKSHHIGFFDRGARRYWINKKKLRN